MMEIEALFSEKLQNGIQALKLDASKEQQTKMLIFLALLQKWNRSFNLTAIDDIEKMITHHLLDSLAIAPYVKGRRILDVGTGGGLPGIPLAILFPEKQFMLMDKIEKKIRFLRQVKAQLKLENVEFAHSRVESYHTQDCFDAIIFRAVGKAKDLIANSIHLCCQKGEFLLMKGAYPQEELEGLALPHKIIPISVPELNAQRHLIIIENT